MLAKVMPSGRIAGDVIWWDFSAYLYIARTTSKMEKDSCLRAFHSAAVLRDREGLHAGTGDQQLNDVPLRKQLLPSRFGIKHSCLEDGVCTNVQLALLNASLIVYLARFECVSR